MYGHIENRTVISDYRRGPVRYGAVAGNTVHNELATLCLDKKILLDNCISLATAMLSQYL